MKISVLRPSVGAVLVGSILSAFCSGIVAMQVYLYYRTFPKDLRRFKVGVATIWILDLVHTAMACVANWEYLIENFGHDMSDKITWTVALTVALTAVITFLVHCFFAYRIFTISRKNYYFVALLVTLAFARVALALGSTVEMIRLESYHDFAYSTGYIFTSGLTVAATVDFLIAGGLIFYLNRSRTGFLEMDSVIVSLKRYTIENCFLTSVVTVISLICWVTMHNLVFLGLHFFISKLYANALLSSLNTRTVLRAKSQAHSADRVDYPMAVMFPQGYDIHPTGCLKGQKRQAAPIMQINVEKTIEHDGSFITEPLSSTLSSP